MHYAVLRGRQHRAAVCHGWGLQIQHNVCTIHSVGTINMPCAKRLSVALWLFASLAMWSDAGAMTRSSIWVVLSVVYSNGACKRDVLLEI